MARSLFAVPPPPLAADQALFLDVDGTLAPFAPTPEAVALPAGVRDDLARLCDRLQGAVALISGRPLDQLDALLHPLQLSAAALHGHQWRHAGRLGQGLAPDPAQRLALERHAAQIAAALPGIRIEDKGDGLALHWRQVPRHGPAVTAAVRQLVDNTPDRLSGYRLQPGDHVLEFVPQGSDKGRALRHLMGLPPFRGRRPVHIGDDLTDEHAFAAAMALGGEGVLIGDRTPSLARYRLPSPSHLHAWLHRAATAPTDGVTHDHRFA